MIKRGKVQRTVKTSNNERYVFYKEKYYCVYEYVAGDVLEIKRYRKSERARKHNRGRNSVSTSSS